MALIRLIVITAVVSLIAGGFCALVGGLIGFAIPSKVSANYTREGDKRGPKPPPDAEREQDVTKKVEFGVDAQKSMAWPGAALGGAIGLTLGAVLGFLLGIVDQVLYFVRGLVKGKEAPKGTVPAAPTAAGPPHVKMAAQAPKPTPL
ncbi:MAG TPA: hypothetical protein VKX17_08105 [Planctomycetota bacterium]|nr:hypothetical protein [Planctomycetota bacterium]